MARDAAAGMNYLSSMKIIHRDLAARNLLAKKDNNGYIVKVGDFGMSKSMYESMEYNSTTSIFAVRWASPEVIERRRFSIASDVFSFGVTLWELLEYAKVPFFDCDNSNQVRERILQGKMLPKPENSPDNIYDLMERCWKKDPETRPSFSEILTVIDGECLEEQTSKEEDLLDSQLNAEYYLK